MGHKALACCRRHRHLLFDPINKEAMCNFVIFHTKNFRGKYEVFKGLCLSAKSNKIDKEWKGIVLGDVLPGNVDPLVITKPWFYSYCQGNKVLPHVKEGSILFFAESEVAKQKRKLKIDTVFVVDDVIDWHYAEKNFFEPDNVDKWERVSIDNTLKKIEQKVKLSKVHRDQLVRLHLVFGFAKAKKDNDNFTNEGLLQSYFGKNQHTGKKTCIGKLYNKKNNELGSYSFLPVINNSESEIVPQIEFPKGFNFKKGGGYMNPVKIDDDMAYKILVELNDYDKVVAISSGIIPYKF